MARDVRSPDGKAWEVGVERPSLLPKWRGSLRGGLDSLESGGWAMELAEIPAIGIGFLLIGFAIIGLSIIGFIILPVLLFAVELIVLLAIAAVAFPYRWLKGDHTVVARTAGQELRWQTASLREAKRITEQVISHLESGNPLKSGEIPPATTVE